MKNTPLLAVGIIVILLIVAGVVYFIATPHAAAPTTIATSTSATSTASGSGSTGSGTVAAANTGSAMYTCDTGTISAIYLNSTLPNSSVQLSLSDGRTLVLPQVMSGSGIRYETGAGTSKDIQFSSEGANAFLTENGKITYNNCVAGTVTTTGNTKSYSDPGKTFIFDYPSIVTVSGGGVGYSTDWMMNTMTSGMLLVKATLPGSFEPKTNFVDATLTVGTSADPTAVSDCLVAVDTGNGVQKSSATINGVIYTKIVSNDAGAGNIYQTTSYRTVRNNQCYAIEYTVHSSQLANYPASAGISAFDQAKVDNLLEGIVQSFKFL
jgi:membrane-bound inhibitor of C-type lysozyme